MATIAQFFPQSAEMPASAFPQLLKLTTPNRFVLAFDTTTAETCYWTFVAPQGLGSSFIAIVYYTAATATTGTFKPDVAVEAVTSGDVFDLDAGSSFDTVNAGTNTTVPGTAGHLGTISITCTNKDSIAAGDLCRISLARDVATDTAAGDIYVYAVELRDA